MGNVKQFLHVIMIQSNFKYFLQPLSNAQIIKYRHFVHKLTKTYPFCVRGFHTPVEWKIDYKVIFIASNYTNFNLEYSILHI